MLDNQPLQNAVAQNNIFLLSFMVLGACLPSEAGITWRLFLTCLAPCWDHWLASLSAHNLSNQVPWASSQHGHLRVARLPTWQLASPRASVLIHRKWRLQALKTSAQKTGTESLLPYFIQQSSHQTHSNWKRRRNRPQLSREVLSVKTGITTLRSDSLAWSLLQTQGWWQTEPQWIRSVHM